MSTSINAKLWLRPYGEIDKCVPEIGVRALPGRLVALSQPLNLGRCVVLPDREHYDPDVCVVVSSGVIGFERGDVVVLAPDHGAYYPRLSPDGRECRMVGVVKPWWESVLAKLTRKRLEPAPGWMLVELHAPPPGPPSSKSLIRRGGDFQPQGQVLASCGEGWGSPHVGERVCIEGLRTYTFYEGAPPSWRLVRAPIASKKWLTSLQRET